MQISEAKPQRDGKPKGAVKKRKFFLQPLIFILSMSRFSVCEFVLRPIFYLFVVIGTEFFRARKVMFTVIAAFFRLGSRNSPVIIRDKPNGLLYQDDCVGMRKSACKKRKTRAAAHGTEIYDIAAVFAVAGVNGEKVFDRVYCGIFHINIFWIVRNDKAQVVCHNIPVNSRKVYAFF